MLYTIKSVLNNQTRRNPTTQDCNCRQQKACPLSEKCQTEGVVYQATVTIDDNSEEKTYVGLTEDAFKTRYYDHTCSFRSPKHRNSTKLSEYIGTLLPTDRPDRYYQTHNPNNVQVIGKIRESARFLNNYGSLKDILENTKLLVSRRQPKNLKRMLTKAQFSSEDETPTVKKCGESRCGTCPIIITGNTINFCNGKTLTVKSNMNC